MVSDHYFGMLAVSMIKMGMLTATVYVVLAKLVLMFVEAIVA